MSIRVALVGCSEVGTWPVAPSDDDPRPWERDDRPLREALLALGATVSHPSWSDPAVDWERFDVALLRSTWDYHHRHAAFLSWVERTAPLTRMLNPSPVVRWNAHKRYLRDLEVPQPPTHWLEQGSSPTEDLLLRILTERGWSRAFVKPAIGATAEGTMRFGTAREDLQRAVQHLGPLLQGCEVLLQPYVGSVESRGERSAIVISGEVTHFVRKIPGAGDWRVQDDYGATDEPHTPDPGEEAFTARVIAALEARWGRLPYARIDWLVGDEGPWLIELELIEPCLFFRHGPHAASLLASLVTIEPSPVTGGGS